jgi:Flp pilus assembly protein TadG
MLQSTTQNYRGVKFSARLSSVWGNTRADRGQSVTEFALMLPLLCLLLIGVVEIGRAAYISMEVSNGATAGVEYGSQNPTTMVDITGMETAAANESNVSAMNANATYGCTCDQGSGAPAQSCTYPVPAQGSCASVSCGDGQLVQCVQVTTQATFTPIFSFPGLPASYSSHGAAVMRVRR